MANVERRDFLRASLGGAAALVGSAALAVGKTPRAQPNIVILLADDMGWGDIGAYNSQSKIPTPNLDRLASQGMRFTDMHASSAVCTTSRYSILTGRYPWRNERVKKGALGGYAPAMIEHGRLTVAGLLKKAGYYTAGVGKWHLGLGSEAKCDYSKPFHPAPTDYGFDYYYGIPASLDMAPYLYFENDRAVHAPTSHTDGAGGEGNPEGMFWRAGPMMPGFDFPQVVPTLTAKAVEIIKRQAKRPEPFLTYFALPAPHTPWVPLPEYKGKSRAGDYGDYVCETDAMVGKVLATLEDEGIADDTIVIFASDNGGYWKPKDIEKWHHRSNGDWKGMKADIWEAGHRIPGMVKWPGHIAPGSTSNETASLTDIMATIASILKLPLPDNAAEDSFDLTPILEQRTHTPIRQSTIAESNDGMMGLREGNWMFIEGLGSGGFSNPRRVPETPGGPKGQLYDLAADPGETTNVWEQHPDIVQRLSATLAKAESSGRTRPR